MNYDENSVHLTAFRLSVKMVQAFEETFSLEGMPHLLPTLRALCLQTINTYLLEDRPVSLEVKNEVMDFYITDFNERNETVELEIQQTIDTSEDPQCLELGDAFVQEVLKKLRPYEDYNHVKTCLDDMRKEDPDEYAVLMGSFFLYTPKELDDNFPTSFLTDYSLPNDVDLDEVEQVFREGVYLALPQLMCLWEHEAHPLHVVKQHVDEIVENSRTIFFNLEEGLVSAHRSTSKMRR